MKKYKLFTLMALTTLFFGCQDAIDIRQPGILDAGAAIQTVDDLNDALQAVYSRLDVTPEIHHASVFTDEIRIGYGSGGQGVALYNFNITSGDAGASTVWARNYLAIGRINRMIAAEPSVDATGRETERDDIMGQAYAIRAFVNHQMLSYFSTDLTSNTALGIPVVDFVAPTNFQPLRNTNEEVYIAIESDLTTASALIQAQSSATFFSRDAINALRARVAAYRGQYAVAAPLAQQLLTAYPLSNTADYDAIFADVATMGPDEVIFKLERTDNDAWDGQGSTGSNAAGGWAGANYAFTGPGTTGAPYYEMATGLWQAYNPLDLRRDNNGLEFIAVPQAGRDAYIVNKYRGSEGVPLMNDLKIFRSSEMLMILAEAAADAGNLNAGPTSVAGLLAQIRTARFGTAQATPVFADATAAWGAILDERRIEFAFEGHRYKDLKRLGVKGNRQVQRTANDCAASGACTLPTTDPRFTWPIPQVEFNGNPGLRAQQNPGY